MSNIEKTSLPEKVSKEYQYEDIFDMADSISGDDAKIVPQCKLCNSEHRAEAEEYWLQKRRNVSAVVRFLNDRDEFITDKAIKNHLENHFMPQQAAIKVKNYTERLKMYSAVKRSQLTDLALLRDILMKSILEIGSEADSLPVIERAKLVELQSKLMAQFVSIGSAERTIQEDWKPADMMVEKLEEVITNEMEKADDQTKGALVRLMNTFWNGLEGEAFER
jgi:hypothetical protein